jgi:cytochrome c-type biogenesis protein CcmH
VTAFIIASAAMLAAALLWLVIPLWRKSDNEGESIDASERGIATAVVSVLVPAVAIAMYALLSNWDWDASEQEVAQSEQTDSLLAQLEERLKENPQDLNGWLLLGRAQAGMGRYPQAVDAYQHAYDLSKGENLDAIIGLGEAMFLSDQNTLAGRAGQFFEAALAKAPNNAKALWYGSVAALQAGDLRLGRDRLQGLLAQNPPPELQTILQRQIDDLNEQLGEAGEGGAAAAGPVVESSASVSRTIDIAVSISPEIKAKIGSDVPLFVLARDPAGGPPLAVQKHTAAALPLSITLSERDAMMATRTIASVPKVQVVARLSQSGSPQAQSGDFFGEAAFEFGKDTGRLNIIIDRTVP